MPTLKYLDQQYVVVKPDEAAKVVAIDHRAGESPLLLKPWIKAVRGGAMVFVAEDERKVRSFSTELKPWPKRNGYRVRQMKGRRDDGVLGWYVWLEPIPLEFPPGYER